MCSISKIKFKNYKTKPDIENRKRRRGERVDHIFQRVCEEQEGTMVVGNKGQFFSFNKDGSYCKMLSTIQQNEKVTMQERERG